MDQSSRFPIAPASHAVDPNVPDARVAAHLRGLPAKDPLTVDHSAENLAVVRAGQTRVYATAGPFADAVAHARAQVAIFAAAMSVVLLTQEQRAMLDAVVAAGVGLGARADELTAAIAALRMATAEPER